MYCLETSGLSHQFPGMGYALQDINLRVPQGAIYGFLGPNGAGKTTTLRLVLGLLRKQQGSIRFFGQSFQQQRSAILQKTGSLIESPSIYTHLTATENLEVWRKIYQSPKSRIDEVLRLTGLAHTGTRKAGRFSLGMKQRLGIAIAMLHAPSLLILDEPTNGLDPNGIIEIRELLKKLNKEQGLTILISSHLLPEIEKLATHVGIINNGRMLFQGRLQELNSYQQRSAMTKFDTGDAQQAAALLAAYHPVIESGQLLLPAGSAKHTAQINRELVQHGMDVYGIHTVQNDLESIFMQLINP
ncbi:ATP-binding cassette domain-containing protein [Chitinophaga horti]|uniref:ATP-binding cassette domain-containing protein n=1 Tax=Chitinophaga horti TaxID=2920382 RepID=A0ABY6J5T8_9BACT|nr:ATP-binding cassette domain-containing protein [Chitinophaga horti]UYQ94978.1 ATP-binding cassette domain-containing protein [Chitinophaga horti]